MQLARRLFLEPTTNKWESGAVLNPTAIKNGDTTHLIYRAVRHANNSCLGHAELHNECVRRHDTPFMRPSASYECAGIEDPRITKIDNTFHLLYTAWDGLNARVALASGDSLHSLDKKGIVSPNIPLDKAIRLVGPERYKQRWKQQLAWQGGKGMLWDKDAILFPRKINGAYVMLHRLDPDIHIVRFKEFKDLQDNRFWENYLRTIDDHVFMRPCHSWESSKIGAGATPIPTRHGWLLLYHGVEGHCSQRVYSAGAALLSPALNRVTRLDMPLFRPTFSWERNGDVNNVVFPEGAVIDGNALNIFYGCADSRIGIATLDTKQLLKKLRACSTSSVDAAESFYE